MTQIVQELALGRDFPAKAIDKLFREADVDGDGKISFDGEFCIDRGQVNHVNKHLTLSSTKTLISDNLSHLDSRNFKFLLKSLFRRYTVTYIGVQRTGEHYGNPFCNSEIP